MKSSPIRTGGNGCTGASGVSRQQLQEREQTQREQAQREQARRDAVRSFERLISRVQAQRKPLETGLDTLMAARHRVLNVAGKNANTGMLNRQIALQLDRLAALERKLELYASALEREIGPPVQRDPFEVN